MTYTPKEYNPFLDCTVEKLSTGQFYIASKYWTINVPSKPAGIRIVEIIQAAYRNGVADNQKAIKEVLGIKDVVD
jgi:hypothetical protein